MLCASSFGFLAAHGLRSSTSAVPAQICACGQGDFLHTEVGRAGIARGADAIRNDCGSAGSGGPQAISRR